MNKFNNFTEFKKKYSELILLIVKESNEDKLKTYIENVSDIDLKLLIDNFCNHIESDKKIKKSFLQRNERIFSEKNNLKIIPSFNLKSFLIKSENKDYIWECIHLCYALYRTGNIKNKDFIEKIIHSIEEGSLSGGNSQEIIEVESNGTAKLDNMIMDIADTLRNNLVSDSKNDSKVNPIENMIKTSQMISERYSKDIKSGKISMNDMFSSLGRMMGEIDKKTSNDEELKNIDVSEMPKPEELLKDFGINPEDSAGMNPMSMLSSLFNNKNNESANNNLSEEQLKEMEEFYSKLGTSDINIDSSDDKLKNMNENLLNTMSNDDKNSISNMAEQLLKGMSKK